MRGLGSESVARADALAAAAFADHADHTGAADPGHDLVAAELAQPFGDEVDAWRATIAIDRALRHTLFC